MSAKNEDRLRIEYTSDFEIDSKLDAAMSKVAKQYGWQFSGTGYDLLTKTRDLGFYRKKEQ